MYLDTKNKTTRLTLMGLLAAISIVLLMVVRIKFFPAAPYLTYDMADIPVLLGAFLLGPLAGMEILFVLCFIQAFFLGGDGIIGFLMHFLASGALVLIASWIYQKGKNYKTMIIGLIVGSLAMAFLMIPLNLIFTVHFFGVPKDVVVAGLIPITIPFNLIKAGLNSVFFFLLYNAISFIWKKPQ
ncbi:MAG: ECF transporter S component [Clostridiales bacterium]